MYVDVELISNNTYQNSTFTYQVPNKLKDKINVGSIVIVPFRNRDYKAIIVSTSNVSLIKNPKPLKKRGAPMIMMVDPLRAIHLFNCFV